MKRELINIVDEEAWAPSTISGTGTVVIRGYYVVGTSTEFLTELKRGDYITVADEAYIVEEVVDDTNAKIKFLGTNVGSTAAFGIINKRIKQMNWAVSSDAAVTINGEDVAASTASAEIAEDTGNLAPIYVDATGGNVQVNILYK